MRFLRRLLGSLERRPGKPRWSWKLRKWIVAGEGGGELVVSNDGGETWERAATLEDFGLTWPDADHPAWGNARVADPHDPDALPLGRVLGIPGFEPREK